MASEIDRQIEQRANIARAEGQWVKIELTLPSITVHRGEDDEFHFQEWAAEELLAEVPLYVNDEDYILAIAQEW